MIIQDQFNQVQLKHYEEKTIELRRMERHLEIIQLWDDVISMNKNNFEFYIAKANSLRNQYRFNDVILCWDYGILNNKNDIRYYSEKANCLEKQDRYQDAICCWEDAILINQQDIQFKIRLLKLLEKQKMFRKIIEKCDIFLKEEQNSLITIEYYRKKGNALKRLEQWKDVIEICNVGISLFPEDVQLYLEKTDALQQMSFYQQILECWDFGIVKNKNNIEFYKFKCRALEKQGYLDEIIEVWDHGISNNLNNIAFYKSKTQALNDQDYIQEIIDCWDFGIANNTNNQFFLQEKISALKQQQRWKEAIDCCNQAIEIFQDKIHFLIEKSFQLKFYQSKEKYQKLFKHAILEQNLIKKKFNFINQKVAKHAFIIQFLHQRNWGIFKNQLNFLIKLLIFHKMNKNFANSIQKKVQLKLIKQQVQLLKKSKKYDDAILCCNKAILQFPNDIFFFKEKASILHLINKFDELLETWDQGVKNNMHNLQFYEEKCNFFIFLIIANFLKQQNNLNQEDKFKMIIDFWNQGIEANPNDINFYEQLCKIVYFKIQSRYQYHAIYQLKLIIAGIKEFRKIRIIFYFIEDQAYINLITFLAQSLESLKDNQGIIDCWERGVQENQNSIEFQQEKLFALQSQERNQEIVQFTDELLLNNQSYQLFHGARGNALFNLKRFYEAICSWNNVQKMQIYENENMMSQNIGIYFIQFLGECLQKLKQFRKAINYYRLNDFQRFKRLQKFL
ncbi:unnamed protein product [Paramecium sonneborni]|uniref:Tetratricopeptide repeat protein n=1 Tax=Paramecium sonneborni TaxID=65129 RepID=A0A8S1KNS8_9CILI|nr:unnamed protein product [Paramecium sonneborni]